MTYKKGKCAEFGPLNVFQFKSDSVKPIFCIRIKVIIIIIIIIIMIDFISRVSKARKWQITRARRVIKAPKNQGT